MLVEEKNLQKESNLKQTEGQMQDKINNWLDRKRS